MFKLSSIENRYNNSWTLPTYQKWEGKMFTQEFIANLSFSFAEIFWELDEEKFLEGLDEDFFSYLIEELLENFQ